MTRDRVCAFWVFLLLLAIYLAFSSGNFTDFPVSDESVMFETTRVLVEKGSLRPALDRYKGQEAKYGLGQSLAAVPSYVLATAIVGTRRSVDARAADKADFERRLLRWRSVAFPLARVTNALICAAIGAVFFLTALRLGYGRRAAIAGVLIVGTATIIAVYSKTFFSEPLAALALLAAACALAVPPGETPSPRRWVSAGIWLGVAVLTRMDNIILAPVFLAGLWLSAESTDFRDLLRRSALFLVPFVLFVLFVLFTNHIRTGGAGGGYSGEGFSTSLATGLYGLLFSPSHGVFWFSPPILFAVFYARRFHRRHAPLSFVIWSTVAIKLFVFAKWWNWFGGWCWGSRFLLPVVPLVMLLLLDPLSRGPRLRRTERALIVLVWVAGIFVQLSGLLVETNAFHGNVQFLAGSRLFAATGQPQPIVDREQLLMYGPSMSPIVGNWPIIFSGRIDWFALRFARYFSPDLLRVVVGCVLAIFLVGLIGIVWAWRSKPTETTAPTDRPPDAVPAEPIGKSASGVPSGVSTAGRIILALNVAFLIVAIVGIRVNGLRRIDRVVFDDRRESDRIRYSSIVYLDDEISSPKTVAELRTEWRGFIDIPVTGRYVFYTLTWGAFDLSLDNQPILTNRAVAGRRSQRVNMPPTELEPPLPRGLHEIRLNYAAPLAPDAATTGSVERRVPRLMQLYWSIPGGGEFEQVIGRQWLYPKRPGAVRRGISFLYRFKLGPPLVSVLFFWWLWLFVVCRRKPRHG